MIHAQMRVLNLITPSSGCELGCEIIKVNVGFRSGQVYASGAYSLTYFINGNQIVQEFPAQDLQVIGGASESSQIYPFSQCYNFAADASYDLKICVDWLDATGVWMQDCKTFTIVSNGQVFPGTINGNAGFCSDGFQNTGVLNLASSFGSEYNWYFKNTSTSGAWVDLNNNTITHNYGPLSETTYYKVVVKNGFCPADSVEHTIQMNEKPVPGVLQEDLVVCKGDNAGELRVVGAQGTNFVWYEYLTQWQAASYIGNTEVYPYQDFAIPKCYRVAVVNPGCPPELTNEICVEIDDVTELGVVNVSPNVVCVEDHLVNLEATGTITDNYQWQMSANSSSWVDVGMDAASFSENGLTEDTYYRLIVKNGVCPPDTSSVFYVQVDQAPEAPSLIGDAVYCEGANAGTIDQVGLSVGSQLIFEQSINDGLSWSSVPFSGTYGYSNLIQSTWYRLIYENGVCQNDTSNIVSVVIDPATMPGILENDSLICTGNLGELNLQNHTGSVVKWQSKSIDAGVWTDLSVSDTFLNFSNLTDTTLYRVIIKSGVCDADTSNVVQLDYVLGPDVGLISGDGVYCVDDVNHVMNLSDYNGNIVDWEISYDGGTFAGVGNPNDVYTATGLTQTVWYRVVLELNNCPYGYSDTVQVQVDPLTDPGVLMQDAVFCEGEAVSFINLINYTDTLLKFEYSDNGGSFWLDALPNVGEDTLSYDLNNTTLYRALVQSGICPPEYSNEVKIIVHPTPDVEAGPDQLVYEGEDFELNGQTNASNFFWTPAGFLDDANSMQPIGNIVSNEYFYFYAISTDGCESYDSVYIELLPPEPIFDTITNAITVNGDGYNDFWVIKGIERYPNAKVELMDKWGRKVYSTKEYHNDFDGGDLPSGNYFYIISFEAYEKVYKGVLAIYK